MKNRLRIVSLALLGSALVFGALAMEFAAVDAQKKNGTEAGDGALGKDWAKARTYLDDAYKAKRKEAKVAQTERCTEPEFVRRAYLDILGRVPSREEVKAWLVPDTSTPEGMDFARLKPQQKREKLIDVLLASPEYADNWAKVWTRTMIGREADGSYRGMLEDWLQGQFAQNRPWNELVYDLLTASGSSENNKAIGYVISFENDTPALTGITSKVFMGKQIQCAQCHKHPYEEITMDDFAGMENFFRFTSTGMTQLAMKGQPALWQASDRAVPTNPEAFKRALTREGKAVPAKFLFGETYTPDPVNPPRKALATWITSKDNKYFREMTVNRYMAHFLGYGFVQPTDDFNSNTTPTFPEILDRMAREFVASGFDLKYLIRVITTSDAYNVSTVPKKSGGKVVEDRKFYSSAMVRRLSPEQVVFSIMRSIGATDFGAKNNRERREQVLNYVLQSFNYAYSDDEGSRDLDDYSGSIPQALMMLNGNLLNDGVGAGGATTLKKILAEADQEKMRGGLDSTTYIVQEIYLSTLSRWPEKWEVARFKKYVENESDRAKAWEDVFWAVMNTTEYVTNH